MSDTPRTFAAIEEYRRYGGSPQNEPVFCSDMFELERELNIITLQRDTLAEALDSSLGILIALMDGNEDVYDLIVTATNKNTGEENKMSVREALEKSIAALAAVKGGQGE